MHQVGGGHLIGEMALQLAQPSHHGELIEELANIRLFSPTQ